ncbi:MAG: outer membrane lipoprotein LolB [Gammaproteobacteria bacterium]
MLAALVAGCAGPATVPPLRTESVSRPTDGVESIQNWRAEGRVAIQRANEGWNAKLRWQKNAETYQLRLIAPFGRGTYQIAGDSKQVVMITPNGDHFESTDARSLMEEQLGWSIPLDGAQYWLRGLAAPDSEPTSVMVDDAGLLTDMQQSGWRISVLKRLHVDGFDLPAKLYFHYQDLKVRIAISAWSLDTL